MMRISLAAIIFAVASLTLTAPGAWAYDYQLYKNAEKFGIVVFPKAYLSSELDGYIHSIAFEPAESGKAVMRYGTKGENETLMMPEEVQARHGIEKFITKAGKVRGKERRGGDAGRHAREHRPAALSRERIRHRG